MIIIRLKKRMAFEYHSDSHIALTAKLASKRMGFIVKTPFGNALAILKYADGATDFIKYGDGLKDFILYK